MSGRIILLKHVAAVCTQKAWEKQRHMRRRGEESAALGFFFIRMIKLISQHQYSFQHPYISHLLSISIEFTSSARLIKNWSFHYFFFLILTSHHQYSFYFILLWRANSNFVRLSNFLIGQYSYFTLVSKFKFSTLFQLSDKPIFHCSLKKIKFYKCF